MGDRFVYIPCRLSRRDGCSAQFEDADGWPRAVTGQVGWAGGRLVVAAEWLREANGRHRVRFPDGIELWVTSGPAHPEDFLPLGRTPDPG